MTKSHLIRARPVRMSSTMPSAKYSCSGSPLMFWNGSTAMEGLSGSARAGPGRSIFGRHRCAALRHSPGPHGLGDIFQRLQTHVVEDDVDLAANLPLRVVGNADA